MNLAPYLDFATETAYLAGRLTLGYFQTGVRPDFKPDRLKPAARHAVSTAVDKAVFFSSFS